MRLSKVQLNIVQELQNGGFIWLAGGHPYIASMDKEGRIRSKPLHSKAFKALVAGHVIKEHEGQWILV